MWFAPFQPTRCLPLRRVGSVPPSQFAKLARQGFFAQYAVMAQYGNTMLAVQSFEQALAGLVVVVEHAAEARAARDSPGAPRSHKSFERRLRRSAKRIAHLFHAASANELRKALDGKVDDELLEEITPLLEWRNFLAHSYLIARLAPGGSKLNPQQAHLDELAELATAFGAAARRINVAVQAIMKSLTAPEVEPGEWNADEAFRGWMLTFIRQLVFVQPPPFSRSEQSTAQRDPSPSSS